MPLLIGTTLVLAGTLMGDPPPDNTPPGGYWSLGETHDRQRPLLDGEDEIMIGSILFSLGLLRTAAAGVTIWMGNTPSACPVVPQQCGGFATYGYVGLGEGALIMGTGIGFMIIGGVRRKRYSAWKSGGSAQAFGSALASGRLQLNPFVSGIRGPESHMRPARVTGGGMRVQVRF